MQRLVWAALVAGVGVWSACGGAQETDDATAAAEAPQASAQEPVASKEVPQITGEELASTLADANVLLLDVRNPDELEEYGTVEGYLNIPIDELADRLSEVPRDKPILTA